MVAVGWSPYDLPLAPDGPRCVRIAWQHPDSDQEWAEFSGGESALGAAIAELEGLLSGGKVAGMVLLHEGPDGQEVGGLFRLRGGEWVDFAPIVNRLCQGDSKWTDVSFYVALLSRSFQQCGWQTECIEWYEDA